VTVTVLYNDASMGLQVDARENLSLPQAWDRVLDTLRAVPGVQSAAGTTTVPFQSPFWLLRARLPQDGPESWRTGIAGYAITPEYLDTVGTRLLQGRNIDRRDGATSERVALVNESFVRTHFDDVDPIGAVVQLRDDDRGIRIVGVVEDVIQQRAEDGFRPALYVPYTQYGGTAFVEAVVRTTQPAEAVLDELRAATARLVPNRQPEVRVMQDLMASTLVTPRFRAFLIGTFALAATMLAAMGLYATMAHHVERRRREIGIRMAIGGHRTDVVWMVLGRGLRLSTVGVTVGIAAGLLVSQALRAYLYGLQPHDAATFGMAAVILMVVSAVACLVPAFRAATVDPVAVLRAD
jgi:predicted permease